MRGMTARLVLIGLLVLIAAGSGRAQDGLTPSDTTLSDAAIDRRLRFIEERLDSSRTHGQVWFWSWLALSGGSALGNGVAAGLTDDEDDRVNFVTSATLGAIGVGDLLFRPLEARYGASRLRGLPEATRQDKVSKLRAAEDQLRRNAARSEERLSLLYHGANLGLATAAGLIVGFLGNPSDGAITGATTALGGTARLLTAPWGPRQDWEDYRALAGSRSSRTAVDVYVTALPEGEGGIVNLRLRW